MGCGTGRSCSAGACGTAPSCGPNEVDVRVDDKYLLGLYVRFEDGIRVSCGPRFHARAGGRYEKYFGATGWTA
jgi:hypothetical protein